MPFIRLISVLGLSLACATGANAQSFSPSEAPPSGFSGREYVDSNGCVFLRSSFGGNVTWVPRYGPDRQQICNASPTVSVQETRQPVVDPVAEPVVRADPPAPAVRSRPARASQRVVRRAPVLPEGHHAACPSASPFGQLVRMPDGRLLVRCVDSRDALLPAGIQHATAVAPQTDALAPGPASSSTQVGIGHYLQVATFGVPANTARTSARLHAQGLPVHVRQIRAHGRALDVVLAGPFTDAPSAHAALRVARGLGFGDAFFRN